ncbi:hypothetical protein [Tellurirhabdus rosea]|uniref:hypothetical protein n=1 Tax=Tellurirhabdus rosea TaxID=2674997 RepID=UPI0022504857|nr:hypothetical protein [Tellurirhabdus rosea]
MKKLLAGVLFLYTATAFAQTPVSTRLSGGIDLGAAFDSKIISPSFTYFQMLHLDQRKIFQIGWTFKFQTFYGQNSVDYYTAPAKFTREKTGFAALSAPIIPANIDTLTMPKTSFTSGNFGLRVQVHLGVVDLGASADILGIGVGKGRYGFYRASTGFNSADSLNLHRTNQYAQPQRINVRLLGDNDMGFLATEVYARLNFSRRLAAKIGYQWLTTEYRANNRLVEDNRRFRHRFAMPYVALTFPFFR